MSLPNLHSPSEILRRVLIGLGVAADPPAGPWPIYRGNEPSNPDNCLTVYDTEGMSDGRSMIDGEAYEHPGFQLRIRAVGHGTGHAKASELRHALAERIGMLAVGVAGGSAVTYLLHSANRLSGVISLGKDVPDSKRYLFTINGTLALRRAA